MCPTDAYSSQAEERIEYENERIIGISCLTNELFTQTNEWDSQMDLFRKVPFSLLRAFEAAGRNLSFTLAAQEINLSPSAISHAIRKLEDTVGKKLFERSTREVLLTREGEALLEYMQRGMEEINRGLSLLESNEVQPLRLHTAPSFATQWLLPRLEKFVRDHPIIDLRVSASTNYAVFDIDDFDMDIVYGEPKELSHERVPLATECLTPLCTPNIAVSIRTPADLLKHRLIQCDLQMLQWKSWFETNHLLPPTHYNLHFDRSSMAIAAASAGLGILLESTLLADRELQAGTLVCPLLATSKSITYSAHYLVYPKRTYRHPAFYVFKDWLLEELRASVNL
ncbi:LysR substrate-binding domain-containing protein [Pseudomonas tolaasii]